MKANQLFGAIGFLAAIVLTTLCTPAALAVPPSQPAADGGPGGAPADGAALSQEELETLLRLSGPARFAEERQRAADEIASATLFRQDDKAAACKLLGESRAASAGENAECLVAAFAKADAPLARARAHFDAGRFGDCAAALKPSLDERDATFLAAARRFLYASALERSGAALAKAGPSREATRAMQTAGDAYLEVPRFCPARLSLACESAFRAGRLFEDMGRYLYAFQAYAQALGNYGLTLSAIDREAVAQKVAAWAEIYGSPHSVLRDLSLRMGEVRSRLADSQTGAETRKAEQDIVRVLEDLIDLLEPPPGTPPPPPPTPPQPPVDPPPPDTTGNRPPLANAIPTAPLNRSVLPVGGPPPRPGALAIPSNRYENDSWLRMTVTERERFLEVMRRMNSEHHRDLVSDYTTAVAGSAGKPAKE